MAAVIRVTLPQFIAVSKSLLRQRNPGMDALETNPKASDKFIAQLIGMREEQICIQVKYGRLRTNLRNKMHQHNSFRAKAGCKHDAWRKILKAPAQNGFRRTSLQSGIDLLYGFGRPLNGLNRQ